jgi:5-methylcytosine-specific restriction protein A
MTEDLGTTKRKPLTKTQRLKLFESWAGCCCICERKIAAGEPWIDEHIRPLVLGGSNYLDNRGPAHAACADAKTHGPDGDIARGAKAKRQKMAALGIKDPRRKRLQGAGFAKAPPQRTASRPLVRRGERHD